jgi:hypothetical protein
MMSHRNLIFGLKYLILYNIDTVIVLVEHFYKKIKIQT